MVFALGKKVAIAPSAWQRGTRYKHADDPMMNETPEWHRVEILMAVLYQAKISFAIFCLFVLLLRVRRRRGRRGGFCRRGCLVLFWLLLLLLLVGGVSVVLLLLAVLSFLFFHDIIYQFGKSTRIVFSFRCTKEEIFANGSRRNMLLLVTISLLLLLFILLDLLQSRWISTKTIGCPILGYPLLILLCGLNIFGGWIDSGYWDMLMMSFFCLIFPLLLLVVLATIRTLLNPMSGLLTQVADISFRWNTESIFLLGGGSRRCRRVLVGCLVFLFLLFSLLVRRSTDFFDRHD